MCVLRACMRACARACSVGGGGGDSVDGDGAHIDRADPRGPPTCPPEAQRCTAKSTRESRALAGVHDTPRAPSMLSVACPRLRVPGCVSPVVCSRSKALCMRRGLRSSSTLGDGARPRRGSGAKNKSAGCVTDLTLETDLDAFTS